MIGKVRARMLVDRLPGERGAEVALEDVADVVEVLDDERLVQVVLRAELRDERGARRLVAEEREDRVARQGEDHEVDEQRGPEEDRDDLQEAAEDVEPQVSSPLNACIAFTFWTGEPAHRARRRGGRCCRPALRSVGGVTPTW